MIDKLLEYLLKAILYLFRTAILSVKALGIHDWVCVEATVTDQPTRTSWLCPGVEFAYSYRVEGELYTGVHKQPFFSDESSAEFAERFSGGRKLLVRVNPKSPEASMMRNKDQTMRVTEPHVGDSRT